jgi:hypothetical protein
MKKLIENWQRFLIESSLSRLYGHMTKHDSAILSAFRNEFTREENYERNRELKARMLDWGFGVTKVAGSYIENFQTPKAMEVSEESFFVSNREDDPQFTGVIGDLGEEYNQDSVLIIPLGAEDAYLLGTRPEGEYPTYEAQESVGSLKMGEESEFMSRVNGRPVTFFEGLETYENLSKNSKWAVKKLVERIKNKKQE